MLMGLLVVLRLLLLIWKAMLPSNVLHLKKLLMRN